MYNAEQYGDKYPICLKLMVVRLFGLFLNPKTLCITEIYNATEKYGKSFSLEDKTLLSQLTIELNEAKYGVFLKNCAD